MYNVCYTDVTEKKLKERIEQTYFIESLLSSAHCIESSLPTINLLFIVKPKSDQRLLEARIQNIYNFAL